MAALVWRLAQEDCSAALCQGFVGVLDTQTRTQKQTQTQTLRLRLADRRQRSDSRARRALQQGTGSQERCKGGDVPRGLLCLSSASRWRWQRGRLVGGRDETNDGLLVASAWLAGVVEKGGACK